MSQSKFSHWEIINYFFETSPTLNDVDDEYRKFFMLYNQVMSESNDNVIIDTELLSIQLPRLVSLKSFNSIASKLKNELLQRREEITLDINKIEEKLGIEDQKWQKADRQWQNADKEYNLAIERIRDIQQKNKSEKEFKSELKNLQQIKQKQIQIKKEQEQLKSLVEHTKSKYEAEIQEKARPRESIEKYVQDIHPLISGFAYEMSHTEHFQFVIKKAKKALRLIDSGVDLIDAQKLTLAELGKFRKIEKYRKYFKKLEEKGTAIPREYQKLKQTCLDSEVVEKELREKFDRDMDRSGNKIYRSGDFVSTHKIKIDAYKLRQGRTSAIEQGKRFFSEYDHSAQLAISDDSMTLIQSHMWGKHLRSRFDYHVVVESDIHRISIKKLIPQIYHDSLEQLYGENWSECLQREYEEKINAIAMDSRLAAESFKIIDGLDSATTVLPTIRTPEYFLTEEDKKKMGLFDKNGETIKNKMVCSEFIVRQFGEGLNQLEHDLSRYLPSLQMINPFQGYNLARITPGKLISILEDAKCLQSIENPFINSLVNTRSNYDTVLNQEIKLVQELHLKLQSILEKHKDDKSAFIEKGSKTVSDFLICYETLLEQGVSMPEGVKDGINIYLEDIFEHQSKTPLIIKFIDYLLVLIGFKKSHIEQVIKNAFDLYVNEHNKDLLVEKAGGSKHSFWATNNKQHDQNVSSKPNQASDKQEQDASIEEEFGMRSK